MMHMKDRIKIIFLYTLSLFFIPTTIFALPGKFEEVFKRGVRKILVIARTEVQREESSTFFPDREMVKTVSDEVAEYLLKHLREVKSDRLLPELEASLTLQKLAEAANSVKAFDKSTGGTFLSIVEGIKPPRLSLIRRLVNEELQMVIQEEAAGWGSFFRIIREKVECWTLRGETLNPERTANYMMQISDNPQAWMNGMVRRLEQGGNVAIEEWVAGFSFLSPVHDLIFSDAIGKTLFRQKLLCELWRRNPGVVHRFFDRFTTVIVPSLSDRLSWVKFAKNFPLIIYEATHPDRRSALFLLGGRRSYAEDKAAMGLQKGFIHLLSIRAMETHGAFEGRTYRDFLTATLTELKSKEGRLQRLWNRGEIHLLEAELEMLDKLEKAFSKTECDFLHMSFDDLKKLAGEEVVAELIAGYGGEWVRRNLKTMFMTSLYVVIAYYFHERPEEQLNPDELKLSDSDIERDLSIKIDLAEQYIKQSKEAKKKTLLVEWVKELRAEREKYRK